MTIDTKAAYLLLIRGMHSLQQHGAHRRVTPIIVGANFETQLHAQKFETYMLQPPKSEHFIS
jgi:hypothetical protein